MMADGVKAKRACWIMGVSTAEPYRAPSADKDGSLREALQWASETPRRG